MNVFPIARRIHEDLYLDELTIHDCGLVQVTGWEGLQSNLPLSGLSIRINASPRPLLQVFRYRQPDPPPPRPLSRRWLVERVLHRERTDVPSSLAGGVCAEVSLSAGVVQSVDVLWKDVPVFSRNGLQIVCSEPHYAHLRVTDRVLGRGDIYGSGPPNLGVHPEIAAMALQLRPPVLDFGCGIGALIRVLRSENIESHGIELDRPPIRTGIPDESRPHITLYDGAFPIPFPDRAFASVVCSEVLEHIPDYEAALAEIARVCQGRLFLTVPDVSAIPLLHKYNVVPWHLLEATHVNFFNQTSLHGLLQRHFRHISFFRVGPCHINGTSYGESLAALCSQERVTM